MSLAELKALKAWIFFFYRRLLVLKEQKIDRNYETRIPVTTHPKKSFHERF